MDACDPSADRGSLWENAPSAYSAGFVCCCTPLWLPLLLLLSVRVPLFHVLVWEPRDDSVTAESEVDGGGGGIEWTDPLVVGTAIDVSVVVSLGR